MTRAGPRLLTHSGTFHADEVTAFATLRLARPDLAASFGRSRDPRLVAQAEIVFDVGGSYDPARGRFDHHMPEPPRRANHDPYSSAGLIWQHFGRQALSVLLGPSTVDAIEEVWHRLDQAFILAIDRLDCGLGHADGLYYVTLIDDCNPAWNAPAEAADAAFLDAAQLAEATLRRKAEGVLAERAARRAVLDAAAQAADPRIIELPASMPWQRVVQEAGLPVLYALYRDQDGLWRIDCMAREPGTFRHRHLLPRAWAGLRGPSLQQASGIADASFVHGARFTGGATSREGIWAMARAALADAPDGQHLAD